jgi:hypothetical protein
LVSDIKGRAPTEVFESSVLNTLSGTKRAEVKEGWRKLHNEELYNLYSSPSIIKMIDSSTVRWVEHVAHCGKDICETTGG